MNNLSEVEKTMTKHEVNLNQTNRKDLMERKRQQWLDENKESENWIFGKDKEKEKERGNFNKLKNLSETNLNQQQNLEKLDKKPPSVPKGYKDALNEYNKIKMTIDAITKAENKIKRECLEEAIQSSNEGSGQLASVRHTDQTQVPAAMRTSLMFGVKI